MITPINHIVKADIRHQKHQALMTLDCKYVRYTEKIEPNTINILKVCSHIIKGPIPITKKEVMIEHII